MRCEALFRGGEVQKLFRGQHPCPVDDGTVGVVDNHVAVGRILPAEEHEVDAELLLQLFLQLFLAAAHVPVFFEDAPQLAATGAFPIAAFEKLFDFGQRICRCTLPPCLIIRFHLSYIPHIPLKP